MWRKVHVTANSFFNFGIKFRPMALVGDDVVDSNAKLCHKIYKHVTIHVVYQKSTAISSQISKENHLSRIQLFRQASQLNFVRVNYESFHLIMIQFKYWHQ